VKVIQNNFDIEKDIQIEKAWKQVVYCSCCRSKVEVEENDLTRYVGSNLEIHRDYVAFCCPCCTKYISPSIPESVKHRIPIVNVLLEQHPYDAVQSLNSIKEV
jgi:hypothetical protein